MLEAICDVCVCVCCEVVAGSTQRPAVLIRRRAGCDQAAGRSGEAGWGVSK